LVGIDEMNLLSLLVYDWTIFVKYKRKCYYSYFAKIFGTKQGFALIYSKSQKESALLDDKKKCHPGSGDNSRFIRE